MKKVFIIISILFSARGFAQEVVVPDVISEVAEELAADESDPEAAALYVELLGELAENPVKVNSADPDELSRLFFLSPFQIKTLADYTRTSGKIVSPYEIANIPGFDRETASMMIPFITLSDNSNSSPGNVIFRSSILTNLSLKSTDKDSSAPGSPFKHLVKYKFTSGSISGGFTTEKDPGERFTDVNTHLPDFMSAHIAYSGNGLIKKVIIGDFGARFGHGTNINTGIRTGLSLTAPINISGRDEIKPYTSANENNFFRGMASQFRIKNFQLSVYYSSNKIDATVSSNAGDAVDFIENLYKTGLHNTVSSLIKKDAVTENSYGINLTYRFTGLNIGMTYTRQSLSLPLITNNDDAADIFDFNGDHNQVLSINYSSLIKRIILSGELSMDYSSHMAFIQGITMKLTDRLTTNFLYRYYEPGFTAFHANGPGSSSGGDNQEGLLGSFTFEAARFLFISAGCDIQHYPWIRYRNSAPSRAIKKEVRIKYIPSEVFMGELVLSKRYSMSDENENTAIPKPNEMTGRSLRCSAKYSPAEGLTFGTRLDFKFISPSDARGTLLFQDVNYRFQHIPLSLWFRHCIFNIDDWESRIYTWENDLLYNFSIPALSGNGTRSYIVTGWNVSDRADLRIKYGMTTFAENTNVRDDIRELRMQFRIRF